VKCYIENFVRLWSCIRNINSDLSEPLIPCETQNQGLHHDEKFHDLEGPLFKKV
jgi:hypothetical protein